MEVLMKRGFMSFMRIDQGGQARVYKSVRNGKTVAIKVVHVEDPDNPRLDDDLKRELQIVRNLRHPNCIKVEELFRTKSKIYIIMEYMPNGTVGGLIRKYGPVCEWNARVWFCPVARAIKYIHDHSIAHRDLKLDNILLDAYMNPIVTDFGYSRFVQRDKDGQVILSDTYCGTTSYNPPEVLKQIPYDPFKGDIWCLGVMLFIMVNKIYPFDKRDKEKMYECQMNRIYQLQSTIECKLSQELKNLIRLLLEPIPTARPSIQEVCIHPWFPIIHREDEFINSNRNSNNSSNFSDPQIDTNISKPKTKTGKVTKTPTTTKTKSTKSNKIVSNNSDK